MRIGQVITHHLHAEISIQVPARPGLGLEVDRSFLARHRVG